MSDFEKPEGDFDGQKTPEKTEDSESEDKPGKQDFFNRLKEKYKDLDKRKQIIVLSSAILVLCLLVTGITLAAVYGGRGTTDPPVVYTMNVSFDPGEDISLEPLTITEEYTLPNITKENYSFGGWFLTSDFSGSPITKLIPSENTNITIYAKWIPLLPEYDMSGASWDYVSAFTYDGSPKTVVVTGLPEGVTVLEYSNGTATDAGTYVASVSFNYDTENYMPPSFADLTWVINKAPGSVDVSEIDLSFVYTGSAQSISGGTGTGDISYTGNSFINAGSYEVTVVSAETNNYLQASTVVTVTIGKANYDMSGASWAYTSAFTYDGSAKTVTVTGLPSGVTINQYTGNSNTNVGQYTASVTFSYDSTNYNEPSIQALSWKINAQASQGLTYQYINYPSIPLVGYMVSRGTAIGDIIIPEEYDDGIHGALPVVRTDYKQDYPNSSFAASNDITSITFPGTLEVVVPSTFKNCTNLTSVTIQEGIRTIYDYAFEGCSALETVWLPVSLESIEVDAFKGCTNLANINFAEGDSKLKTMRWGSIDDTLMYSSASNGMVYVGTVAYKYKGTAPVGSITVNPGTLGIADNCFEDQPNINSIILPEGLEYIGHSAFRNCSLSEIILPESLETLDYGAFTLCKQLEAIVIPSKIDKISDNTFEQCDALVSVTLPEGIIEIERSAFFECLSLESINLPSTLTLIDDHAFSKCESLSSITIPKSAVLGNNSFLECLSMTEILVDSESVEYKSVDGVLFSKNGEELLLYPVSKEGSSYTTPVGVKTIEEYAFRSNKFLETVIVSEGVTLIRYNAFSNMEALDEITIAESVEEIEYYAFWDSRNLYTLNLLRPSSMGITAILYGSPQLWNWNTVNIYVPDAASETAYKAGDNWAEYASRIQVKPI